MCLVGAKGETANELKAALSLDQYSDSQIHVLQGELIASLNNLGSDVVLDTANKVFSNRGFEIKNDFSHVLKKHFASDAQQLDFSKSSESSKAINDWVLKQTRDKIEDLIPEGTIDEMTKLILVNAIYFNGNWLEQFDEYGTSKSEFKQADGTVKEVDMMRKMSKQFYFKKSSELKADICEFPYVGRSVAMTIILPNEGVNISEVEKKLTAKNLSEALESLPNSKVNAAVPKFKMEYKAEVINYSYLLFFFEIKVNICFSHSCLMQLVD
jgi:serpin B